MAHPQAIELLSSSLLAPDEISDLAEVTITYRANQNGAHIGYRNGTGSTRTARTSATGTGLVATVFAARSR